MISEKINFKRIFSLFFCVATVFSFCGCSNKREIETKEHDTRLYTSNAALYVDLGVSEPVDDTATLYNLTSDGMLVDTCIEILSGSRFFDMIAENTDMPYSTEQMKNMVTYSKVDGTDVIYVCVTASNPEDAYELCNAVLEYANVQIMNVMDVDSVKVIDEASIPVGK